MGATDPATVARLSCDASITRIVLSPDSEPLDVGRRTPVVSTSMRRALIVRDRHCRFPGCDRPSAWCDAHHIHYWEHMGVTDLENLVLLCSRHHHLVHEGGWQLHLAADRTLTVIRPGGHISTHGPPLARAA